jgi:hypothetical protein
VCLGAPPRARGRRHAQQLARRVGIHELLGRVRPRALKLVDARVKRSHERGEFRELGEVDRAHILRIANASPRQDRRH